MHVLVAVDEIRHAPERVGEGIDLGAQLGARSPRRGKAAEVRLRRAARASAGQRGQWRAQVGAERRALAEVEVQAELGRGADTIGIGAA